jgi:hypothetical protein
MEGKERTITCVSGTYSRPRETKPTVWVFGLDGRSKAGDFAIKKAKKGWSVELKLRDWAEIAIISED